MSTVIGQIRAMSKRHELSRRAAKLLRRLHQGVFYPCNYDSPNHKAMRELLDKGLVGRMGRVQTIRLCYVPKGAKPFKAETIPEAPKWLTES